MGAVFPLGSSFFRIVKVVLACMQLRHLLPNNLGGGYPCMSHRKSWQCKLDNKCTVQFIWLKHYYYNDRRKPLKFYAYDNGTGAHCPPKLQL